MKGPGSFMSLPIHAASFYDTECSQPESKVLDFVISSSLSALFHWHLDPARRLVTISASLLSVDHSQIAYFPF